MAGLAQCLGARIERSFIQSFLLGLLALGVCTTFMRREKKELFKVFWRKVAQD